jgi:hypothetical protein
MFKAIAKFLRTIVGDKPAPVKAIEELSEPRPVGGISFVRCDDPECSLHGLPTVAPDDVDDCDCGAPECSDALADRIFETIKAELAKDEKTEPQITTNQGGSISFVAPPAAPPVPELTKCAYCSQFWSLNIAEVMDHIRTAHGIEPKGQIVSGPVALPKPTTQPVASKRRYSGNLRESKPKRQRPGNEPLSRGPFPAKKPAAKKKAAK